MHGKSRGASTVADRRILNFNQMAATLSAYELQRAANIRQNNAKLEALGLDGPQPEVMLQPVPRQPALEGALDPAAADIPVRRRHGGNGWECFS